MPCGDAGAQASGQRRGQYQIDGAGHTGQIKVVLSTCQTEAVRRPGAFRGRYVAMPSLAG